MKIYTKRGDGGETSLYSGLRVGKDQIRIQVCGDIDELSSVLGIVRAEGLIPQQESIVIRIQQELIEFGAEIANPNGKRKIEAAHIEKIEAEIDEIEAMLLPLTRFIIPGADKASAFLHLARTVCRRAERDLVTLNRTEPNIFSTLLIYLNRLSDLLFVMARQAEHSLER